MDIPMRFIGPSNMHWLGLLLISITEERIFVQDMTYRINQNENMK
jgi:hypothetical protein